MNNIVFRRIALVLLSSAAWGAMAPAVAQSGTSATGLDEIVVTAQRRAQNVQDVSIAVSAYSGDALAAQGVVGVNQLENIAPSLQITNAFGSGQVNFTLRGVGFSDYATLNSPTVGVYVNEVAYPIAAMTQGALFDIERVEVLRGPQGTLYGRNTTGGAISFVTNRPTSTLSAGITAEYGRFDRFSAEGFISGPLAGDTVKARLAATTIQGGAWQFNRATGVKLGDQNKTALRGTVEAALGEAVTATLTASWYNDKSDGLGLNLFTNLRRGSAGADRLTPPPLGPGVIPADPSPRSTGWGTNAAFARLIGASGAAAKPFRDNEGWGVNLNLKWDLGAAQLASITAYEKLKRREYNDWDASDAPDSEAYFNSRARVFSQELRLSSNGEGPLRWLIGGYYGDEDLNEQYFSAFQNTFGLDRVQTPYKQKVRTLGIFGQAEYEFTDQLNLVFGLRYEDEKRRLRDLTTFVPDLGGAPGAGIPLVFVPPQNRDQTLSEVTGKVALEYRPTDDALLYASISRGVKSGGFTAYNTLNIRAVDPFKPESLWAYELGFKAEFAERTLRLNGAVYYYDYSDQQVLGAILDPTFGPIGRFVNAPKSEIYGGELELTWQPTPQLRITQALSVTEAKFKRYNAIDLTRSSATCTPGPCREITNNLGGTSIGTPDVTYQGSISYDLDVGGFTLQPASDWSYRGRYDSPLLGPIYSVGSYWLVNASLTLSAPDAPWSVTAWARNLFNERYEETRNFFVGANLSAPGEPVTYGVRASYKF
jgi:iron complex outermembrane recepter protein